MSETCVELNKNLLDWTCPRLASWIHLDDSIPRWSGELVWDGTDISRENISVPRYKYSGYDYIVSEGLTFLDPPSTHYSYMQLVIIAPHIPEYELILGGKPHLRHGFAIDACDTGIIAGNLAHNYTILSGLIEYMRGGCGGDFLEPYTKPQEFGQRPYDYYDSPGWIYRQWVAAVEELCKGKC